MASSKKFSFQMVSDLHLEFIEGFPYITPLCQYIFLLGDIGSPLKENYWKFIDDLSRKFRVVCIVTGNHEYYNSTIDYIDTLILNRIKSYNNVYFLNGRKGQIYTVDDIVILGTTLWSYIPREHSLEIANAMNDYKLIHGFNTQVCNILFNDNVNWLRENLEKYKNYKKLVFTHHTPLLNHNTSYGPYESRTTNHAFSSDLSSLVSQTALWGYGHTHYNHPDRYFKYGNTFLLSNQQGYPNSPIKNYISDTVFTFTF